MFLHAFKINSYNYMYIYNIYLFSAKSNNNAQYNFMDVINCLFTITKYINEIAASSIKNNNRFAKRKQCANQITNHENQKEYRNVGRQGANHIHKIVL